MSDYGSALLNATEEYERDAAEEKLVFRYGVKLSKDGNQWCALLGESLQDGHGEFGDSPKQAISKMRAFIYSGKERR